MRKDYKSGKCLDCECAVWPGTIRCRSCKSKKSQSEKFTINCKTCNKEMRVFKCEINKKYCSWTCRPNPDWLLGKNHWNYKDGRTNNQDYRKKFRKEHQDRYNLYQIIRTHKVRSNGGSFTEQEWFDLKKKFNFYCPSCKRQEPEIKLTVDHIIPITKGGTSDISNIQPLCGICNSKKYNKIMSFQYA